MKERIQQRAKDLFHQYGFKSVTMDEIASQLGVSKKTIYQYYSDKDELVHAVVHEMIAYARNTCDEHILSSRDAVHELFQAIDFVREIFADMNPSMMYDLERFHPAAYQLFLDYKNKYLHDVIRANLKRGIEEDLYRPDINIEIISRFRLEGMMLVFNPNHFPPVKFNMLEVHQQSMEHFLFGVASLKGYKLIQKYQQERNKS